MKTLKESENVTTIVLEDNDQLKIETLKGNPIQLIVECKDGVISVDEVTLFKIEDMKMEENQLEKLKEFIEKES